MAIINQTSGKVLDQQPAQAFINTLPDSVPGTEFNGEESSLRVANEAFTNYFGKVHLKYPDMDTSNIENLVNRLLLAENSMFIDFVKAETVLKDSLKNRFFEERTFLGRVLQELQNSQESPSRELLSEEIFRLAEKEAGELTKKAACPISTIDLVQQFIKTKDWTNAEKSALKGLKAGNETEKLKYYEFLEEIYNTSNPKKLEQLWSSQGQSYLESSQFSEAEKLYEKAFNYSKSFSAAFNLAHVFRVQNKNSKSIQTYYEASMIALFNEEFDKSSLCIKAIREIDPQMEALDPNQRKFLLMQCQLLKGFETFQNQQQHSLFKILTLAPSQHQPNLLDSIFHNAVIQEQIDIVKMITQHYDLVSINSYYGNEPLIITAVEKGNEEIVRTLLTHPDMNTGCKQSSGHHSTALAIAEQSGFSNIITILYTHSQSLEQDFTAFKKKSLGEIEHLHVHSYQGKSNQQCLIITGISSDGNRKLLDISSYPLQQTLQQHLEQLENRGLKDIKLITINDSNSQVSRDFSFSKAQIYKAQTPAYTEKKQYSLEREKIRTQLGMNAARNYEELSEKIDDLVKDACVDPYSEAVIYRAMKLKGEGYFTE